jgi:hypothetical protein
LANFYGIRKLIWSPECAKSRLLASAIIKYFPPVNTQTPLKGEERRKEGEAKEEEGKERSRDGGRRGRYGEGRDRRSPFHKS